MDQRFSWIRGSLLFAVALATGCTSDIDLGDSDGGPDAHVPDGSSQTDGGACSLCEAPPTDRCRDSSTLERFDARGACVAGTCEYPSTTERCAAGCVDGRCADDRCAGVVCESPPPSTCRDDTRLLVYDLGGSCAAGSCEYPSREILCPDGCADGRCRPPTCADATCDAPPSQCVESVGSCIDGACRYDSRPATARCDDADPCTVGDVCGSGECAGAPLRCDAPPVDVCVDASTLRVFDRVGACAAGACEYRSVDRACASGCEAGRCRMDACVGVTCNRPPTPSACYASTGSCADGQCSYAFVDGACDDGDPCTGQDRCNAGVCRGTAIACNAPPADVCVDAWTRRTYAGGTCEPSGCSYAPTDLACPSSEVCSLGRCAPRCGFVDPTRSLGASSDSLGAPAVAHRSVNGATLIVWTDFTRNRVLGELHQSDGSIVALSDIGAYAADPLLEPFSDAGVVADDAGFGVVWVERTIENGVAVYRFRYVSLDFSGAVLERTIVPSGLRLHFTDVDPRLFGYATARVLVYRGRTAEGSERTVARTVSGPLVTTVFEQAAPSAVCVSATPVVLTESGPTVRLRRASIDGTLDEGVVIDVPAGSSGTLRCAPAADGYYVARGAMVFRVRNDGSRVGEVTTLASPVLALAAGEQEAAVLARAATGGVTLTRIAESSALLGRVDLDVPRSGVQIAPDSVAWTGQQWVAGWSHDDGLRDQARMTRVCRRAQ